MIRLYAEFDSREEAEAWREAVYRQYDPLGYGTHIRIEERTVQLGHSLVDGSPAIMTKWIASGSRAESCD